MSNANTQDSMRTPLKQARGMGSSRSGVGHWWAQRFTAIILVPLGIWFLWFVLGLVHADHAAAMAAIGQPLNALLLIVFLACMFWHGALGLQVIIEDYVHTPWLEITLQLALRFAAWLAVLGGVMAILSIWLR